MLRILSGCGRRWADGLGDLGGGDLREWVGMGRAWLLWVAINTVLGMGPMSSWIMMLSRANLID